MPKPQQKQKNLARHRRALKQRGIVRLEVRVRREDAPLVRRVAEALTDPAREASARAVLREGFAAQGVGGLKALLAAAPLDGIDLLRATDMGRTVDL
ncbi:MAG: hypothetical protein JNK21_00745 [Rhodospirillaceae bacterium]|nr:hypothetical protein [Rhodospirillaceae bacterium]